jgi:hypothetical protein
MYPKRRNNLIKWMCKCAYDNWISQNRWSIINCIHTCNTEKKKCDEQNQFLQNKLWRILEIYAKKNISYIVLIFVINIVCLFMKEVMEFLDTTVLVNVMTDARKLNMVSNFQTAKTLITKLWAQMILKRVLCMYIQKCLK